MSADTLAERIRKRAERYFEEQKHSLNTANIVNFSVSEVDVEREQCCKDVCASCRGQQSPSRNYAVHEKPELIEGKWIHKYLYYAPNVLFRKTGSECNASAIRNRDVILKTKGDK